MAGIVHLFVVRNITINENYDGQENEFAKKAQASCRMD